MNNLAFFEESEISHAISRIEELLNTGIFGFANSHSPFVCSAFIEVMIYLNDLMCKAKIKDLRIRFTEDVELVPGKIDDVSDLIRYFRDAVCHVNSDIHFLESSKVRASFCVNYGKGCLLSYGEKNLTSNYDDDICFFMGKRKIYLIRHIVRALNEAKDRLLPLSKHNQRNL